MTGIGLGLGLAPRAIAKAAATLQSQVACTRIFTEVRCIMLHDERYTTEQRALIYRLSLRYNHFTAAQLASIAPRPWQN